jgi:hypothetical protein
LAKAVVAISRSLSCLLNLPQGQGHSVGKWRNLGGYQIGRNLSFLDSLSHPFQSRDDTVHPFVDFADSRLQTG